MGSPDPVSSKCGHVVNVVMLHVVMLHVVNAARERICWPSCTTLARKLICV